MLIHHLDLCFIPWVTTIWEVRQLGKLATFSCFGKKLETPNVSLENLDADTFYADSIITSYG